MRKSWSISIHKCIHTYIRFFFLSIDTLGCLQIWNFYCSIWQDIEKAEIRYELFFFFSSKMFSFQLEAIRTNVLLKPGLFSQVHFRYCLLELKEHLHSCFFSSNVIQLELFPFWFPAEVLIVLPEVAYSLHTNWISAKMYCSAQKIDFPAENLEFSSK